MPQVIGRDLVQRLTAAGALLVEVLPPKQYEQLHLPGAVNIPLTKLHEETVSHIGRDQAIIVYCYDFQ